MPSIVEHDKANSTKEKTEIERYLIRIIERYFQIETEYSRNSMEAIVQESFTRLKRYMYKYKGFIFSFNRQTGHVWLDIKSFNGEPEFEKNTAYNKDFGTEENTICEGNDKRLYDARTPLEHTHELTDIIDLGELLDASSKEKIFGIINSSSYSHAHNNKSVLDILRYTGSMAQIDLILLEDLEAAITDYLNRTKYHRIEAYNYNNEKQDYLNIQLELLNRYLDTLQENVILDAINWLGLAYNYTLEKGEETLLNGLVTTLPYRASAYRDLVLKNFNKMDKLLASGSFNLSTIGDTVNSYTSCNPIEYVYSSPSDIYTFYNTSYSESIGNTPGSMDYWQYNQINNAIKYTSDNEAFNTLTSLDEPLTDYTIRVNCYGTTDDDAVCILLGKYINNTLTLMLSPGGTNENGFTSPPVPHISIIKNFCETDMSLITKRNLSNLSLTSWSDYTNGITLLIKKTSNAIKIWYSTVSNAWSTINSDKTITESSTPFITLNIATDAEEFKDAQVYIGLGTYSQIIDFKNLYIYGLNKNHDFNTSIGYESHTNYSVEESFVKYQYHTIGTRIKIYFQYKTNTNKLIRSPLPFKYISPDGKYLFVNAKYDKLTGYIDAYLTNVNNIPVNLNCPDRITIGNDVYIPVMNLINDSYEETFATLARYDCDIPILTETLQNQLETMLATLNVGWKNRKYIIRGHVSDSTAYSDFTSATTVNSYYLTRINGTLDGNDYYIAELYNENNAQNLELQDMNDTDVGFLLHYKNNSLASNINNPQIYYQILGRDREV